jgi:DNA-binding NarL/FixJ family response regulator
MRRQKRYQKSILVRVSNDEFRQLTERSEQAGVSLSRLLVESALTAAALTNEQRQQAEVELFVREWAVTEVARVGNNLNQIARQLNSQRGTISTEKIEQVLAATYEAICALQKYWSMGRPTP